MMMACITYFKARFGSKKGQGMVEYGLIVGGIAVVVVAAMLLFKGPLNTLFSDVLEYVTGSNEAKLPG
jgi:pilus assembly protein Flp/PilA